MDISGLGVRVTVRASRTFPVGFTISEFADDADSIDVAALTIAETAMGLNGDLLTWSNANPVPLTLNVIPNSDADRNLTIIGNANRPGRGRNSANDVITVSVVFPDGRTNLFRTGVMINYMPVNSIASAGRLKSKPYNFMFENVD